MTETFQLKRGGELEIQLVSAFYISRVRGAARKKHLDEHHDGQEPEPPTYTVHYGGGKIPNTGQELPTWTEEVAYTEESIEAAAPDDKKLWAEYVQATNEILRAEAQAAYAVYFDRGVLTEPPESDDWSKTQREDGLDVPDRSDRRAYKLHWLDTEMLLNQQEANWLIMTIKGQGDQVREMQRTAASMFQRPVAGDGPDS